MLYRPVRGDKVRVGLNGVFVEAPAAELGLEVGTELRVEVPLPNGVTIQPLVVVIGVDEDFFAGDYVALTLEDRAEIDAYYASRPSVREILVEAAHAKAVEAAQS